MRVCREYCDKHNIAITEMYIDRATSASHHIDKRTQFLRMISDSGKDLFDAVVVYKLDRFARNRYDSATYKAKLKRNGVRLISATENLTDTPESIILESVLEGMAEFYSAELSQKIRRGMYESAHKHKVTGGAIPLGYRFENKEYLIDEKTAHIVQEAFHRYANGERLKDIERSFNEKGYRTSKGASFTKNSFHRMLTNKRYLGYYIYKDYEAPGVLPQLIDQQTWDRVQMRVEQNRQQPGSRKAKDPYLLLGKLICGHCNHKMVGDAGTGKSGNIYHYYTCAGRKRKRSCDKKPVPKAWIENVVVDMAKELLTDEFIEKIAKIAVEENDKILKENGTISALEARLVDIEKSLRNLTKAIETGMAPETIVKRIGELEKEKALTAKELIRAEKSVIRITEPQVIFWLSKFRDGDYEDPVFRHQLIDMLVSTVIIWDTPGGGYKITAAFNLVNQPNKTITTDGIDSIKECSDLAVNGPLLKSYPNTFMMIVMTKLREVI